MNLSAIKHDPEQQLFTMDIAGHAPALVSYVERDGVYRLVHSEVPYSLRGQGIGKQLVEATFEYLVEHKMPARAVCSYIRAIAMRSPKWKSIIQL